MFSVTGQDFLTAIVHRLSDKDVRCHDSAIVAQIRNLTDGQLHQIVSFGDVTIWRNERINKREVRRDG